MVSWPIIELDVLSRCFLALVVSGNAVLFLTLLCVLSWLGNTLGLNTIISELVRFEHYLSCSPFSDFWLLELKPSVKVPIVWSPYIVTCNNEIMTYLLRLVKVPTRSCQRSFNAIYPFIFWLTYPTWVNLFHPPRPDAYFSSWWRYRIFSEKVSVLNYTLYILLLAPFLSMFRNQALPFLPNVWKEFAEKPPITNNHLRYPLQSMQTLRSTRQVDFQRRDKLA